MGNTSKKKSAPRLDRPERQRPITQTQIAKALGLSRATVSFVINGRGDDFGISAETQKRVLEMVGRLQYVPNAMARSLKTTHTGTVAVLVADFQCNWVHRLQVGLEQVFRPDQELTAVFAPRMWDAARERREIDWFMERRAAAIIVCVPIPDNLEYYRRIRGMGVPLLFVGDTLGNMPEADYVVWDAADSVATGMRHLYDLGRRRIGFVGIGEETSMTRARYVAYDAALRELGLPREAAHIHYEAISSFSQQDLNRWFRLFDSLYQGGKQRPDALFALNDALALSMLNVLYARPEIRLPEDLAIVGMGGLPIQGPAGHRITSMDEPMEQIGEQAARCIQTMLDDQPKHPLQHVIKYNKLIVRETTVGWESAAIHH